MCSVSSIRAIGVDFWTTRIGTNGGYWQVTGIHPSQPRRGFPNGGPRDLVADTTGQHRKVHLLAATPDSEGQAHVEGAPLRVTRGRKERVSVSPASRDHLEVDWDSATAMLIFDPSTFNFFWP